jgi:hypothetical protein
MMARTFKVRRFIPINERSISLFVICSFGFTAGLPRNLWLRHDIHSRTHNANNVEHSIVEPNTVGTPGQRSIDWRNHQVSRTFLLQGVLGQRWFSLRSSQTALHEKKTLNLNIFHQRAMHYSRTYIKKTHYQATVWEQACSQGSPYLVNPTEMGQWHITVDTSVNDSMDTVPKECLDIMICKSKKEMYKSRVCKCRKSNM